MKPFHGALWNATRIEHFLCVFGGVGDILYYDITLLFPVKASGALYYDYYLIISL